MNDKIFPKLKYKTVGGIKNYSMEELCKFLKLINNIIVDKFPINS